MKRFISICCALVLVAGVAVAQSTYTSSLPAKAKKGATVYGVVEADGKPLAGVAVSDGYEIALTDKNGVYSLNSAKKNGYVFLTIPSGYEVEAEGAMPCFWAELTAEGNETERHDFLLKAVDQSRHAIMAVTDIHLANQFNDIEQFKHIFMPRLREEVEKYRSQGIPVYTLCMGDSSFDLYWYDFLYEIKDFRTTLQDVEYPTQMFHTMGNHDNDPSTVHDAETDFNASYKYRKVMGPTYFSFNIGDVHYIMLDNIVYYNEKTPDQKKGRNVYGRRNYEHAVTSDELDWLAKDLALVKDKNTPIVVGMHCPVYRYKNRQNGVCETLFRDHPEVADALSAVLKEFKEVHFLTGHTHKNQTTYVKEDTSRPDAANTIDHNIAAVAGSWWQTYAQGGCMLGPDGGPAGFEVFTADGSNLKWYFTSNECGAEKQFRAFDLNAVRDYYTTSDYAGEMQAFLSHYPKRTDFGKMKDNQVWIHVWAWENGWKIRVTENGKELKVTRKPSENPQYTACYYIPKSVWRQSFSSKYGKDTTPHMFRVEASAPDTTLEIEVTDTFGNVYRETMVRPKAFSKKME